jgi:hypothetical protein
MEPRTITKENHGISLLGVSWYRGTSPMRISVRLLRISLISTTHRFLRSKSETSQITGNGVYRHCYLKSYGNQYAECYPCPQRKWRLNIFWCLFLYVSCRPIRLAWKKSSSLFMSTPRFRFQSFDSILLIYSPPLIYRFAGTLKQLSYFYLTTAIRHCRHSSHPNLILYFRTERSEIDCFFYILKYASV